MPVAFVKCERIDSSLTAVRVSDVNQTHFHGMSDHTHLKTMQSHQLFWERFLANFDKFRISIKGSTRKSHALKEQFNHLALASFINLFELNILCSIIKWKYIHYVKPPGCATFVCSVEPTSTDSIPTSRQLLRSLTSSRRPGGREISNRCFGVSLVIFLFLSANTSMRTWRWRPSYNANMPPHLLCWRVLSPDDRTPGDCTCIGSSRCRPIAYAYLTRSYLVKLPSYRQNRTRCFLNVPSRRTRQVFRQDRSLVA